ncbi:MAG: hypothetical protein IJ993_00605, partial [Akkermansia sp.]|nr:hypothetical protein [Akkermansia sp.]
MSSCLYCCGACGRALNVLGVRRLGTKKSRAPSGVLLERMYVNADRLRFDFSHFSAMTAEEIAKVEAEVNANIQAFLPVVTEEMGIEDARKTGAMALFGEKYGEKVRVVQMGNYSVELCGGTHVANTGNIANFKIVSESGVAAGVRRIEALTGNGVTAYYKELEANMEKAAKLLKANPDKVTEK